MSELDVEIVRGLFEGFSRNEYLHVLDLCDPDIEFVMVGEFFPDPGTYKGAKAMAEAFAGWLGAWEQQRISDLELVDLGDRVVSFYTLHTRGRASGIEVEERVAAVYTFREGKIVRLALCTREQGLRDAGLAE